MAFFRLQGFNFGLRSAVIAFNRAAEFDTRAAVRVLQICVEHYFDDFAICEPSFARGGQDLLVRFGELLGLPFSAAKSQKMALKATFLGVEHDFTTFARTGELRCSVSEVRLASLVDTMGQVLSRCSFAGVISPDTLLGKLQIVLQWAAYRFGRAAMQPLFAHSHGADEQCGTISLAVRAALVFLVTMLPALQPWVFRTRRAARPPVLVWSDAAWEIDSVTPAMMGFVMCVPAHGSSPERWWHSSLVVPTAFMEAFNARTQYIGQLELLAAVAVYYSLPAIMVDAHVLHFVDNTSALFGVLKGYSSVSDSARIVHAFWAMATGLRCAVWFEYVQSAANIADLPSRGDTTFVTDTLKSTACATGMPPIADWLSVAAALAFASDAAACPVPHAGTARKRRR